MRELRAEIFAVAETESSVLITGETGTGKGLTARILHARSPRRDRPFVHVDCAALSPTVIESELFGHERGAFTGAEARRSGRFELAAEGTIFLDEIGELDRLLQSKLLRVLDDREYERMGGTRTLEMKARIVAATNVDLRHAIERGGFRADLFFRLNVFHLRLPPLRERIDDIPLLVQRGLGRLVRGLDIRAPEVSEAFLVRMMTHRWPGNVRELMNVLERLVVRGRPAKLVAEDLDGLLGEPAAVEVSGCSAPEPWLHATEAAALLSGVEGEDRRRIAATLGNTGGNVMRAARRLGMSRSRIRYRIRKYGLQELISTD